MKKKYITITIISTIIIASTVGFVFLKKNIKDKTVNKAEYYKIASVEKVFINGILTPRESESIYIDSTKGEISEVNVTDGQVINAGDSLFTYNNPTIESQIEEISEQIKSNENSKSSINNKLTSAKNNLSEKEEQLKNLKSQLEGLNLEEQLESNSISMNIQQVTAEVSAYKEQVSAYEEQIDNVNITLNSLYNEKEEQLKNLKSQLEGLNLEEQLESNSISMNIQQVTAEVSAYKEQVSAYEEQIDNVNITLNSLYNKKEKLVAEKNFVVTAPIGGKVVLSSNEKDYTQPYIIIESQELIVKGVVSEKDYKKIKVDDDISVNIISTNETVDGKILEIDDRPVSNTELNLSQVTQTTSNNVSYYNVLITLNYKKIKVDDDISVNIISTNETVDGKILEIDDRPVSNTELNLSQVTQTTSNNVSYYNVLITLNSQDNLINGFHSQGKVTLGDDTIKVFKTSIINEEGKNYVFVDKDGILDKVEISIKEEEGEYVIVESGLNANDVVMKDPTSETKVGVKVE